LHYVPSFQWNNGTQLLYHYSTGKMVLQQDRPIKNPVAQHETRFFDFAVDFYQINFLLT